MSKGSNQLSLLAFLFFYIRSGDKNVQFI